MKTVDAGEVYTNLNKKNSLLIDVRTDLEYQKGHIDGSIHIPLLQLQDKIQHVAEDINAVIYLYCLSGSRSVVAAETLESLGYTHAYSMTSGLLAWRMKGYPLVS